MLTSYYFLSTIQTFFITIILFCYKSGKTRINRYLGFFFLTLFAELIKILLIKTYHNVILIFLPFSFNFTTIVFLFFYALETLGEKVKRKERYFITGILEFLFLSSIFIAVLLDSSLIDVIINSGLMDVYAILSSLFIGFYCVKIMKVNASHQKILLKQGNKEKPKTLRWLSVFCWICIFLNLMGFLERYLFVEIVDYHLFVEIVFLLSLYYISLASLMQINIANVIDTGIVNKSSFDSVEYEELVLICDKIDNLILKEKLYLNSSLNLSFLASQINISDRMISKAINVVKKKNFNHFIHEYRIREFKMLVQQDKYKNYSIEALANEIGYNSRASFYKNFKKIVGISPMDFIEELKN